MSFWAQTGIARLPILLFLVAAPATAPGPQVGGCPLFPSDHIWNTPVNSVPVDSHSGDYVRSIGENLPLHPDFGAGLWRGSRAGIPFVVVQPSQSPAAVALSSPAESDAGPFPIPADAPIEGGPSPRADGDRHVLVVQAGACRLIELFAASPQPGVGWRAATAAVFPLRSYKLRPEGWTSADAAGLPILPGLVRYEEVAAGRIAHAVRFTAPRTRRAFVWPARHFASTVTDPQLPPMGQRFRLKSSFPLDGFSHDAKVILEALRTYGMMLADNGGPWFLSGAPDPRWNNAVLEELKRVKGADFEAVDVSALMMSAGSGRARRP
jgi:hypothetical protein